MTDETRRNRIQKISLAAFFAACGAVGIPNEHDVPQDPGSAEGREDDRSMISGTGAYSRMHTVSHGGVDEEFGSPVHREIFTERGVERDSGVWTSILFVNETGAVVSRVMGYGRTGVQAEVQRLVSQDLAPTFAEDSVVECADLDVDPIRAMINLTRTTSVRPNHRRGQA